MSVESVELPTPSPASATSTSAYRDHQLAPQHRVYSGSRSSAALVQRRGDAELPADGRWRLHRASFVGIATRRSRRQLSAVDGSLMIVQPPDASTLLMTAALGDLWMRLTATTTAVDADRFGFSRWTLTGIVDDGDTRHDIELGMTYHGVHGRRDWARAWFTGRATSSTVQHRSLMRRAKVDVVLDLLFDPPTSPNTIAP
jgi:hypothetical protein